MSVKLYVLLLSVACFFAASHLEELLEDSITQILDVYDEDDSGGLDDHEWDEMYAAFFPEPAAAEHDHDHLSARRSLFKRQATELCHPADELFTDFDTSGDGVLNRTELEPAVVVLFSMLTTPSKCITVDNTTVVEEEACPPPERHIAWISGVVASIIISLVALVIIAVLPSAPHLLKLYIVPLIAFAIGTLLGDAFLHLIPEALGVHSHTEEAHTDRSEKFYLGPSSFVILGIFVFLALERLLHKYHHHGGHEELELHASPTDRAAEQLPKTLDQESPTEREERLKKEAEAGELHSAKPGEALGPKSVSHSHLLAGVGRSGGIFDKESLKAVKPSGWMVIFADGIHNFVDGLALGIAFSQSFSIGVATAIAVFVHEVPQEIGDFALLISSGFSKKQAMFFNSMSAITCIIGTLIGLGVGEATAGAGEWLLPLVAGGFIYIALVDMMPIVLAERDWKRMAIDGATMLLGYVIMLVIALWVEEITLCGDGHNH